MNIQLSTKMEFVKGTILPLEEDIEIEFKMHTKLCTEEILKNRTRRAISRNINGFLNSGKGGKIYLGIQDDGEVIGLSLSNHQKEHLEISLEDLLNRYTPPVPSSLYKLTFVPVIDDSKIQPAFKTWSPTIQKHSSKSVCSRAHLIRTSHPCWCFTSAKYQIRKGARFTEYIAEIIIYPTVVNPITTSPLTLRQFFCNEGGLIFNRKAASVWKMSVSEIVQSTREEVNEYYEKILKKYQQQMKYRSSKFSPPRYQKLMDYL